MSDPQAVLVVVDTETGGLKPEEACILEIAATVLEIRPGELDPGEMFHTKIAATMPVHPKAAEVNGYTVEKWAGAPPPKEALASFTSWLDDVCASYKRKPMWCGCNPLFDVKFFKSDSNRVGVQMPEGLHYRMIDVQSLCLPLLLKGEVKSLALKNLRTWAGCEGEQSHTAEGDVLDTCQVIGAFLLRVDA